MTTAVLRTDRAGDVDDALRRRVYIERIAARGVEAFVSNGRALEMRPHAVGDDLVPVIISQGRTGSAAITSPTAHYLDYPLFEIARRSPRWQRLLLEAVFAPVRIFLRLQLFDRVVYVNHWLMPNGPSLRLTRESLVRLVDDLTRAYPDHALVFPGIIPSLDPCIAGDLRHIGGLPVPSRVVHLLHPDLPQPGTGGGRIRRTRREDDRLRHRNEPFAVEGPAPLLPHLERVRDLYAAVYLQRHPAHLNCQYTKDFFELLLDTGLCKARAWIRDGGLEAFDFIMLNGPRIESLLFGLDTSLPRSRGLLRTIISNEIETARAAGLILNLGGGNVAFKRFRGAEPHLEYDVVFDRHLPRRRRGAWQLVHAFRARRYGQGSVPA